MLKQSQYEAVYTDREEPGYYLVRHHGQQGESEVLKVPLLELQDRNLICEYEALTPEITDEMARILIIGPLLTTFSKRYYEKRADFIKFFNRVTGTSKTVSYQ